MPEFHFIYFDHSPTTSIIEILRDFLLYFFIDIAEFRTFLIVATFER